jgi:hypothetical protein
MTTYHSIQIIKDMAEASGIDTNQPDWQQQLTTEIDREEEQFVDKMTDLMADTIRRSATVTISPEMDDGGRWDALKVPFHSSMIPEYNITDPSAPIDVRLKQAAGHLIRSYD